MTLPDLGNAHVIDWYLWRAVLKMFPTRYPALNTFLLLKDAYWHDPEDWTRYDGELL